MFDKWTALLCMCALGVTLVAVALVLAWLVLRPPTSSTPETDAAIFVPVAPGPFAPTRARVVPDAVATGADARPDNTRRPANAPAVGARFRILPGSTVAEVLRRLDADPRVTQDLAGVHANDLMRRLGLGDRHAEGQFLPNAYPAGKGATASGILREAHDRLRMALAYAWRGRAVGLPYATPDEALIVASIVARETALAEDRPRIAAVFARRLHLGMRLQADPSVIYGLGPRFDGTLTRRHLTTDTPYNTYTRHGLPPTPIALPGIASIEAALHPATATTALYFVGRGDGTTEFSDTLAEHKAAVRRYRR